MSKQSRSNRVICGLSCKQLPKVNERYVIIILFSISVGKHLMACRSAVDGFRSIVNTIGGEQEKARAKYDVSVSLFTISTVMLISRSLLDVLEVVEDCPSARAMALTLSHRVKHRAKVSITPINPLALSICTGCVWQWGHSLCYHHHSQ